MRGTSQEILAVKRAAVSMTAARLLYDNRGKTLPDLSSTPVLYSPDVLPSTNTFRSETSQLVLVPGVNGVVEGQGQA